MCHHPIAIGNDPIKSWSTNSEFPGTRTSCPNSSTMKNSVNGSLPWSARKEPPPKPHHPKEAWKESMKKSLTKRHDRTLHPKIQNTLLLTNLRKLQWTRVWKPRRTNSPNCMMWESTSSRTKHSSSRRKESLKRRLRKMIRKKSCLIWSYRQPLLSANKSHKPLARVRCASLMSRIPPSTIPKE